MQLYSFLCVLFSFFCLFYLSIFCIDCPLKIKSIYLTYITSTWMSVYINSYMYIKNMEGMNNLCTFHMILIVCNGNVSYTTTRNTNMLMNIQ